MSIADNTKQKFVFGFGENKSEVTVWCDGRDYDPHTEFYRPIYSYQIKTKEWAYVSNDIRGADNEKPNLYAASQSLFAFLYACCTSSDDSEDRNMFPSHVQSWGDDVIAEISRLSIDSAKKSNDPNTESFDDVFGIDDE
jgi:hypothetical protein